MSDQLETCGLSHLLSVTPDLVRPSPLSTPKPYTLNPQNPTLHQIPSTLDLGLLWRGMIWRSIGDILISQTVSIHYF